MRIYPGGLGRLLCAAFARVAAWRAAASPKLPRRHTRLAPPALPPSSARSSLPAGAPNELRNGPPRLECRCETGPRRGSQRTGAAGAALGAVPLERGGWGVRVMRRPAHRQRRGLASEADRGASSWVGHGGRRRGGWGSSVGPAMMGARRKGRTAARGRRPGRPPAEAARLPTGGEPWEQGGRGALGRW